MVKDISDIDPVQLFGDYMSVTGVPTLVSSAGPDPRLSGKKLGVVNGASWTSLWSSYFGRKILPGVKIVNAGNEAVQLNFMRAYHRGEPCPPQINIDLLSRYARELFDLIGVDAVLISCSTMSRAYRQIDKQMRPLGVPVIQIDEAMMEEAVSTEGTILVVATHCPTIKSTCALLQETAAKLDKKCRCVGAIAEEAFECLGRGDIAGHNNYITAAIERELKRRKIDIVVLAQISMAVFGFSCADPAAAFGVKVLNSAETGFERAGEVLRAVARPQTTRIKEMVSMY